MDPFCIQLPGFMMWHKNGKGPQVAVQIYASKGKIYKCSLEMNHDTEGLCWAFRHDVASRELENLLSAWFEEYCSRQEPATALPFNLETVTPFSRSVLAQLQKIPFGAVRSYGEIAVLLHNPQASRAVGTACGKNPVPLFFPCHRVLPKGKGLGGFSCGVEIKKLLLAFESGAV